MHRYIFHHIFMEDGTKAVVGIVCQPCTCSRYGHFSKSFYISIDCTFLKWRNKIEYRVCDYHIYCQSAAHLLRCTTICYNLSLECGFISLKGGIHYPVDSCTLSLRDNGEGGITSSDYGFEFTAGKVNHINNKSIRCFKPHIFQILRLQVPGFRNF